MKLPAAIIAILAVCFASPALSGPAPTPAPHPEAQRRVSLNYRGPLREAVKHIADDAKLNVVVRGEAMAEEGDFHFENVPAQEALSTLASAYNLILEQHGSVFTLRPLTGAEQAAQVSKTMRSVGPDVAFAPRAVGPSVAFAPVPPIPPIPPIPSFAPKAQASDEDEDSADDSDNDAEDRQEQAEQRRADMQQRREDMQQRREDMRERLREMRERMHGLPHHSSSNGCDVSVTGNYTVEEGQEACDVVVWGGNLEVLGHVKGDVAVYGGNIHLGSDAEVQGDVVAFGGDVTSDEGAEIHGEQMSIGSGGNGMMTKGAKVIQRVASAHASGSSGSSLSWKLPKLLLEFACFFALSFIFLMFAPARMKQIEAEVKRDPVKCGVAGLVGSVALVPMSVMLFVLIIIGWPFLAVLWLLTLLGVGMGATAIAAEIGTRLPVLKSTRKTQAAVLALGIGVLLLVELIPYLGPLILTAVAMVSLGAVIRTRFGGKPQGYPEPI
jgi:hypothetical protein